MTPLFFRAVLIIGVVMLIPTTVIIIRTLMRTKEPSSPHRSCARTVAAPFVPGKNCATLNQNTEKLCNNQPKKREIVQNYQNCTHIDCCKVHSISHVHVHFVKQNRAQKFQNFGCSVVCAKLKFVNFSRFMTKYWSLFRTKCAIERHW